MSLPSRAIKPLENAVGDLLLASRSLMRRLREDWYERELSWSQIATLAQLEREGPMTTADLARAQAMKPQSMGTALAGLEREGLVERRPHPTDGRQVLFALTADGLATRQQAVLVKRAWLAKAMAALSPAEQQTLIEAAALIRRLEQS